MSDRISVYARVRASNKMVLKESDSSIKIREHSFNFDRVLVSACKQKDVYTAVLPKLEEALDGYRPYLFYVWSDGFG